MPACKNAARLQHNTPTIGDDGFEIGEEVGEVGGHGLEVKDRIDGQWKTTPAHRKTVDPTRGRILRQFQKSQFLTLTHLDSLQ